MEAHPYFLPGVEPREFIDLEYGSGHDRVTLRAPVVTPSLLVEAIDRITRARDGCLAGLPVSRIVDAIDATVERWQDPEYSLRRTAEELMPAITGYSRPMVREGLPALLKPFRREGLLALLEAELGDPTALDGSEAGTRLTTHILAGNIPAVPAESLVHALLVKSASLVKASSGDPLFPALFAQTLAEVDPDLAASVAVVWWKGGQGELEREALAACDAVIAYGSDATIESVRALAPPGVRLITYGHRMSFAAVGREALRRATLDSQAAKAAWDIGFFDQQGCVSPHAVYVERGGEATPLRFAEALAREMQRLEERLPRGRLAAGEAAAIQQARATWELRQAAGEGISLFQSQGSTAWTVVYEESVSLQASCLNRVVRVVPIDDLSSLPDAVRPMSRYLQSAGLAVSRERLGPLASALAGAGVTRVCDIGRMQHPPAVWPHDGRPNLLGLATWVDPKE